MVADAEVVETSRVEGIAISIVERPVAIAVPTQIGVAMDVAAYDAPLRGFAQKLPV